MGDINQLYPEIDAALDAAALELNVNNPFKHIGIPYLTHINTVREAVAIDHFYIATGNKKIKVRGNCPDKVLPCLKKLATLLDEQE